MTGGESPPEPAGLVCRVVTICNRRGLHARAAAQFVHCAGAFDAQVTVSRGDQSVSGLSILGLMMLAAGPGSAIKIDASGTGAEACLDALCALVEGGFEED